MAIVAPGVTWTRKLTYTTGQGSIGGLDEKITKPVEQNASVQLAAAAVNQEVDIAFTRARLRGIAISVAKYDSTETGTPTEVVAKSNSTSSPGDTETIPYGTVLGWIDGDPTSAKPFSSADVIKVYVSNPSTVAVVVKISLLLDAL